MNMVYNICVCAYVCKIVAVPRFAFFNKVGFLSGFDLSSSCLGPFFWSPSGDENNFVLISLVRSNSQCKLGFVGERNRLIVAMSRARCGVYLFGNDHLLEEKSKDWKQVPCSLAYQFVFQ